MKKRKLWVSLLAGFLALVMLLGLVVGALTTYVSAESSAEIQKRLEALEVEKDAIDAKIEELEQLTYDPNFWGDQENSGKILRQLKQLKDKISAYENLCNNLP